MLDFQTPFWILRYHHRLRQRDFWTRETLLGHQMKALRDLRALVYAHSPFYQRFHQGLYDAPLQRLPILTKSMVMEHFKDLVTVPALSLETLKSHVYSLRGDERFAGHYRANATSGTTGLPGVFLFNEKEWAMVIAAFARASDWACFRTGLFSHPRVLVIGSEVSWHMSARINATLAQLGVTRHHLDASASLEVLVDGLNRWQPDLLVTYPSIALPLIEAFKAGQLQKRPKGLILGSEVLTKGTRRLIEDTWGKILFEAYGTTECGLLAAECECHAGLHLCEDLVIAEVVDQNGLPVNPGQEGAKLLLTVLFNHTQPLIRYEISDLVCLSSHPCSCGRPYALVESIKGRIEEVLSFPGQDGGIVSVHPNVFHGLLESIRTTGWQVVQGPQELDVLLSGTNEGFYEEAVYGSIRQALLNLGAMPPPIRIQRVDIIPRDKTGKIPLIKRLCKRGNDA